MRAKADFSNTRSDQKRVCRLDGTFAAYWSRAAPVKSFLQELVGAMQTVKGGEFSSSDQGRAGETMPRSRNPPHPIRHANGPDWKPGSGGANPMPDRKEAAGCGLTIAPNHLDFRSEPREWRNWQTRQLEGLVVVIPCRFKSCFPHFFPPRIDARRGACLERACLPWAVLGPVGKTWSSRASHSGPVSSSQRIQAFRLCLMPRRRASTWNTHGAGSNGNGQRTLNPDQQPQARNQILRIRPVTAWPVGPSARPE
jgi:hypothetical protein